MELLGPPTVRIYRLPAPQCRLVPKSHLSFSFPLSHYCSFQITLVPLGHLCVPAPPCASPRTMAPVSVAPIIARASMRRRQGPLHTGRQRPLRRVRTGRQRSRHTCVMSSREFKQVLGFHRGNNRVYRGLRGEIKVYMNIHDISSRTQAGEFNWRAMMDWVLAHDYLHPARLRYPNESPADTMELRRAVHFLCLSIAKSIHSSRRLVEQNLQNPGYSETPPPPSPTTPSTTTFSVSPVQTAETIHRTIRIALCDPDQCPESGPPSLGEGIVRNYCATLIGDRYQLLASLLMACRKHIPAGRALREIRGGTGSQGEDVSLSDNEEVEAWLSDTRSVQPLRVLAVLREVPLLSSLSRRRPMVVSIQRPPPPSLRHSDVLMMITTVSRRW